MPSRPYRFDNVWSIRAPSSDVFKALVQVDDYPLWWRDIRWVHRIDEDSGLARCRSVLPFGLTLQLRRAVEDPEIGRLRVDITGDLEGFCAAHVDDLGGRTVVRIAQQVVLHKRMLQPVEPLIRPVLRGNHHAMMWRGQRGLRAHLERGEWPVHHIGRGERAIHDTPAT